MRVMSTAVIALAAAGVFVAPQSAEAQSDGWWQWALQDVAERDRERGSTTIGDIIFGRDDDARSRRDRDRRDDRRTDRRDRNDRGNGPPFCRNGQGHPVHGQQWCRDKGFGTDRGVVWRNGGLGDIIFGSPRDREKERRGALDRGGLMDVLGDVVFGRVDDQRRRLGGSAPLEGRWVQPRDGMRVLQIRSGGVPVAELTDVDGDGRVDYSLVPQRDR